MIQKKFLCRDAEEAKSMVSQIESIISSNPHKSALITFYESGLSESEVESFVGLLRNCGFPELRIAGISIPMIAELMPEPTGMLINLIIAEKSDIEVVTIPCKSGEEASAGKELRSRLDAMDYVRAVEFFGSNMELKTTVFIENAMEGHEDAVLFGTSTLRNITKVVSVNESENVIEVEQVDKGMERDELIVGDEIIRDGFVAVVFAGNELIVESNYALGWKPIGRKLPIELGENPAKGESLVISIDSMPAIDIYREYLGVYPDAYLTSNICEFPLVAERDGINICMVPIDHGKNGELYFMLMLNPGDKLRFSFASHDEVLYAFRESLKKMEIFQPEALFLTLCGNRLNFLKEDAHIEWDEFAKVAPEFALMHGAGEVYYHNGKGGILNSAHVSVGMRESDVQQTGAVYEHPSVESLRRGRVLSLSDRMSTFLDKITSELIDTATQAQDANNAKSAFLSHMSHEIRTPINAILGMDEMIIKESSEEGIVDYADSIRSAGNNLLGIVNDILDFSKIEAGKMSIIPAEYELITTVKDQYNIARLRAEDKGLQVVFDIDPEIPSVLYGDALRCNQVVTNLLTNAVKYTETGTVTFILKKISDGTTEDEEELRKACPDETLPEKSVRVRVAVKDTGIGIKPEDMGALFEEYERFDEKRNRKIEGTGLGLSITKELLELMGTRLKVESTYGEGSEFSFEIMQGVINEEPFGDLETRLKKKPVAKKKRVQFTAEDARILVVDDTQINLKVVTKLLKNTKINVDTAESGEEALRLVREHEYDVIFLDHKMSGMDGPETLRRMKELKDNLSADTPVISLTASTLSNARDEYIKAGYKDYLSKPFRPEELEDMLFYYIPSEKIRTVN